MRIIHACLPILLLVLLPPPAVRAAPPATAQTEIEYLLAKIGGSDCKFYRNGSWYDAKRARMHLQQKYDYLAKRNLLSSADDFIAQAATQSSLSGRAYAIKCNDETVPSAQWLRDALLTYRASNDAGN